MKIFIYILLQVAPFLLRQLFSKQEIWLAFEDPVLDAMDALYRHIFGGDSGGTAGAGAEGAVHFSREDAIIVAGTMFWVRLSELWVKELTGALPWLEPQLTTAYRPDGGVEHILERLIPSMVGKRAGLAAVREMIPAPRPLLVIYPEAKGEFRNKNYFDFDNLAGVVQTYYWEGADRPLLRQKVTRAASPQFMLAWGARPCPPPASAPTPTSRLGSPPEEAGRSGSGDETDWRKHFQYILPLLKNPDYIRFEGEPVFVINVGSSHTSRLPEMLELWVEMGREAGVSGIYFISLLAEEQEAAGAGAAAGGAPVVQAVMELFPSSQPLRLVDASLESLSLGSRGGSVAVTSLFD
jgi:hypothetical protein